MDRRGFIIGVGALLAAPAIVRASSIMPVRSRRWEDVTVGPYTWRQVGGQTIICVDGDMREKLRRNIAGHRDLLARLQFSKF